MHTIKLSEAIESDIPEISRLAAIIWRQYYPAVISHEQINYMLGRMYSTAGLNEQMVDRGHIFYLVVKDGENIGFLSVNEEEPGRWFINKFYIRQDLASRGIGSAVFQELCRLIPAKEFRLTVNRKNFKAINFYFRNGFKIESVADFDIGEGYQMNDFVMRCLL